MRIPDRRRDRRDAWPQDPEDLKCDFFQIATFVITVARD
jgi:hypothetical protein